MACNNWRPPLWMKHEMRSEPLPEAVNQVQITAVILHKTSIIEDSLLRVVLIDSTKPARGLKSAPQSISRSSMAKATPNLSKPRPRWRDIRPIQWGFAHTVHGELHISPSRVTRHAEIVSVMQFVNFNKSPTALKKMRKIQMITTERLSDTDERSMPMRPDKKWKKDSCTTNWQGFIDKIQAKELRYSKATKVTLGPLPSKAIAYSIDTTTD